MAELRMVLAGKVGTGKSSSGNIILGRRAFRTTVHEDPCCQKEAVEFEGKTLTVVDTPGLMEVGQNEEEMKTKITRCISMCPPGPHVFLLVIDPVRPTRDDVESVENILKFFGSQATKYIMILFTHGDELAEAGDTIEDILHRNPALNSIIRQFDCGYHVFNNREEEDRSQVRELLHKITQRSRRNGGSYYTIEMLEDHEKENKCIDMVLWGLVSAIAGLVVTAILKRN